MFPQGDPSLQSSRWQQIASIPKREFKKQIHLDKSPNTS